MKYPDLNSANSYLFTLKWRKYFWVFDLFGSFIIWFEIISHAYEASKNDLIRGFGTYLT